MKKQTFTKQAVWQAAAVGVLAVGGVLFCLSGQIGIGQTYRQVRVDDRIIGYAPENTDILDSRINMTRLVPQLRVLHKSQPA